MTQTDDFTIALDDVSASILALDSQISLKVEQLEKLKTSILFIEMEAQRAGAFSDEAKNTEQRKATENGFLLQHDTYQYRLMDTVRLTRSIADLKAQKAFERRSYDLLANSEV